MLGMVYLAHKEIFGNIPQLNCTGIYVERI